MIGRRLMPVPRAVTVGFRVHSGWAVVVAVAGTPIQPVIVERRRIELAEKSRRETLQPYHTARELGAIRGRAFLDQCRVESEGLARSAVWAAIKLVGGDRVRRGAILVGSGRRPPSLEATIASHAAVHTAE